MATSTRVATEQRLAAFADLLNNSDFVPSLEAARFVRRERTEHPEEFDAWLQAHAQQMVADEITRRDRYLRSSGWKAVRNFAKSASVFSETADPAVFDPFTLTFVVDDLQTRRPLARMTRDDCLYAAMILRRGTRTRAERVAFLTALQARLGDGQRVEDALSRDEVAALIASVQELDMGDLLRRVAENV